MQLVLTALTNQSSSILTNQTGRIWSPYLHEDRQIRVQGWGLRLYKPASLCFWKCTFPPPRLSLLCWAKHQRCLAGAENRQKQNGAKQSSTAQSRPAQSRAIWPEKGLAPELSYSSPISQLSCFSLNQVSFFTTLQIRVPLLLNWGQWWSSVGRLKKSILI